MYFEFGISHQQTTFYFVIAKHERGWGGGSGWEGDEFWGYWGPNLPLYLYTYLKLWFQSFTYHKIIENY